MTVVMLRGARTYDQQLDEARIARLRRMSPTTDPLLADDLISSTATHSARSRGRAGALILTGWGAQRLERRRLGRRAGRAARDTVEGATPADRATS